MLSYIQVQYRFLSKKRAASQLANNYFKNKNYVQCITMVMFPQRFCKLRSKTVEVQCVCVCVCVCVYFYFHSRWPLSRILNFICCCRVGCQLALLYRYLFFTLIFIVVGILVLLVATSLLFLLMLLYCTCTCTLPVVHIEFSLLCMGIIAVTVASLLVC